MRARERLCSDKSSYVFKHLQASEECVILVLRSLFSILETATTKENLKSHVNQLGGA